MTDEKLNLETDIKKFKFSTYANKLKSYSIYNYLNILNKTKFDSGVKKLKLHYNANIKRVELILNPEHFFSLKEDEKLFTMAHEALHIMLNHHQENREFESKEDKLHLQIAQNLVVNEMLVNDYKLDLSQEFVDEQSLIENTFTPEQIETYPVHKGRGSLYYMSLLKRQKEENPEQESKEEQEEGNEGMQGMPSSGKPGEDDGQEGECQPGETEGDDGDEKDDKKSGKGNNPEDQLTPEEMQALIDALKKEVENINEEAKKIQKMMRESSGYGLEDGPVYALEQHIVKKQSKWERLLKKYVASIIEYDEKEVDSFLRRPKRLMEISDEYFLPETLLMEEPRPVKKNAFVFLDFSGSCTQFAQTFFDFLDTFPEKIFEVTPHYFTTHVTKIEKKDARTFQGGGTNFQIIENYIQNQVANDKKMNGKYPDIVVVFTDGEAPRIRIQQDMEKKWIIVDVTNRSGVGNRSDCIDNFPNCKVINIQDVT